MCSLLHEQSDHPRTRIMNGRLARLPLWNLENRLQHLRKEQFQWAADPGQEPGDMSLGIEVGKGHGKEAMEVCWFLDQRRIDSYESETLEHIESREPDTRDPRLQLCKSCQYGENWRDRNGRHSVLRDGETVKPIDRSRSWGPSQLAEKPRAITLACIAARVESAISICPSCQDLHIYTYPKGRRAIWLWECHICGTAGYAIYTVNCGNCSHGRCPDCRTYRQK